MDKSAYFQQKYDLSATHSEVKALAELISPCKVLDLGCGRGRNALYLSRLGFDVTAVDQNEKALDCLRFASREENLPIQIEHYDIHQGQIKEEYDLIFSTVVLMFLRPERVPAVLQNMQAQTRKGGYNLIVVAMDTQDCPCPVGFSAPFKEQVLLNAYAGWKILKYNENMGELHKLDAQGKRLKMRFATLLAQKEA